MNKKVLLSALLLASCTLAGCGAKEAKGEAYGLTHGAGYVSQATVTVKEGKVTAATLVEVCLPTYVQATEAVPADDKVTVTVMSHGSEVEASYYKTVSYGSVEFTYDATAKAYVSGGKTLNELFAVEANAKAYYEAVMSNQVSVTVGGAKKADVLTKAALCKEDNGYWTMQDDNGNDYSRWKLNRDATIEFLLANGIDSLMATVKGEDGYWANGDVKSGATWSDMNSVKEGSISYAQLLKNAVDAAK